MTTDDQKHGWVPGALAVLLTIMAALAALTPYVVIIPKENLTLITQAQTTLWAGWLLMLGYYFGSSSSQKTKDATIQTQAETAAVAQGALAPLVSDNPDAINLAPGEQAKVVSTLAGTTIEPRP